MTVRGLLPAGYEVLGGVPCFKKPAQTLRAMRRPDRRQRILGQLRQLQCHVVGTPRNAPSDCLVIEVAQVSDLLVHYSRGENCIIVIDFETTDHDPGQLPVVVRDRFVLPNMLRTDRRGSGPVGLSDRHRSGDRSLDDAILNARARTGDNGYVFSGPLGSSTRRVLALAALQAAAAGKRPHPALSGARRQTADGSDALLALMLLASRSGRDQRRRARALLPTRSGR
ncbi:hypothetical protein [Pacificoceanicola onchidii]|uniref:hypothetical protein n=1 Tax=Pacificoceanicola onchidii TaxID=2562685 RepID=UPI001455F6BB|nr:hypothetical protein [Pacificoceanicola onchidii]